MKNLKSTPHPYERQRPAPMPFVVYASQRTRISFWQRFSYVLRHRPVLVLGTLLCLLTATGWALVSSLPTIASYLIPKSQPPSAGLPGVIAAKPSAQPSPTMVVKMATPIPATPTATPTAAPGATPTATPQPSPSAAATPAAKSVLSGMAETGRFTLQISAHPDLAEAAAQVTRMKGLGLSAKSVTVTLPQKGVWHRVYVGRFATREEAQRAGQLLQAKKSISDFLVAIYQE